MSKTQVRPSRDLRNNYADIVTSLKEHDHVIITNNGVGEAVLIGIEDYAEYEKFLHYRFIYDELQKSKAAADGPNTELRDVSAVFARVEQKLEARGL
jgi:prevent-host-death family protein